MTHDEIVAALTHDHPQYRDCYRLRGKKHDRRLDTHRTPTPGRREQRPRTIERLDPPGAEDIDFPGCVL